MGDTILRAYRVLLVPTIEQQKEFGRIAGTARAAYNWTLAEWRRQYRAHKLAETAAARAKSLLVRWGSPLGADERWDWEARMPAFAREKRARRLVAFWSKQLKERDPARSKKLLEAGKERYKLYHPNPKPTAEALHKKLNVIKKTEMPWMDEAPSHAVREAVLDVGEAYAHFFRRLKEGKVGREAGEPRFRSKHNRRAFHMDEGKALGLRPDAIRLQKLGWVSVRSHQRRFLPSAEYDPKTKTWVGAKICAIGISEELGEWYAAVRVEVPRPPPRKRRIQGKRLGVEVGVRALVVASDGCAVLDYRKGSRSLREARRRHHLDVRGLERRLRRREKRLDQTEGIASLKIEIARRSAERATGGLGWLGAEAQRVVDSHVQRLACAERTLALWSRRMSRRYKQGAKKQSASWVLAKTHLKRCHAGIARIRDELLHYAANRMVDSGAATIVMREPAVKGMIGKAGKKDKAARSRNALAPLVSKIGWYELRRKVEYKQNWSEGTFIEAPAKLESSRICSACGAVRDVATLYPNFTCPSCGHREDRDDNSTKVLKDYQPPSGGPVDPGGTRPGKTRRKSGTTAEGTAKPAATGQPVTSGADWRGASPPPLGLSNGTRPRRGTGGLMHDPTQPRENPGMKPQSSRSSQGGEHPGDDQRVDEPVREVRDGPELPEVNRSQGDPQPIGSTDV